MHDEADADLRRLCDRAGVATQWSDIFGKTHQVAAEDLRDILAAIGLGVDDDHGIAARIEEIERELRTLPPLITAAAGERISLPLDAGDYRIELEDGSERSGRLEADLILGSSLSAPAQPGYHTLVLGDRRICLAVAPERCFSVSDAIGRPDARAWGIAVQLYSLRRPGDGGVGDYPALAGFARQAAARGADALAISPVHAQFSADPDRFSPYAPSSRVMLNVLHVGADETGPEGAIEAKRLEELELVDWPAMSRNRLARLRREYDAGGDRDPKFSAWRAQAGEAVDAHALFEALHAHVWGADHALWHWRDWPAEYASMDAPGIAGFRDSHAAEIGFHAWLQFRADGALAAAQQAAVDAGMTIGLISDLAVGTDSGGSHCWSRQGETLRGLTVGAPPDLLQIKGQNWGITAFSARGLRQNGYQGFIEMLRGAMRHAGGVRIDHGMGIARLWVIPEGKTADHGSYLAFPEQDLRRLIALESQRNRAIVLAEDLGTVPEGFQDRLQACGIDGMRILMFERDDAGFTAPRGWTRKASAMTSTHDLPPVAGWWAGQDIEVRGELLDTEEAKLADERADRKKQRAELWHAMRESGAAHGEQPADDEPGPVVDAALAHAGGSACEIVMIPLEDVLALPDQPNLPGTVDEHPNWRRRLGRPVESVLDVPAVEARLAALAASRKRSQA
ncbi:4-alpha-glucanotransferase [Lichenicoccus roseus]|uniref:4-alpha-glucanotransferase n=1 Tax=Lichenicoccus roseus TaxID=2683649 RepID=A0A5R9JAM9_9PROT|nr:4-alpha-glucanotransferase [Lichenicoccus roseus]TLU72426.1 4-alpha-glucanotransferase [Lichenicoccus roseus]